MDLTDAVLRQAERDELADAVVGEVPADRAASLGQQLDDAQIGQRIGLQPAQRARDHHPVEAGGAQLFDQCARQALLAVDAGVRADLDVIADDDGAHLRDLDPAAFGARHPEPVGADDHARMKDAAHADRASVVEGDPWMQPGARAKSILTVGA